MTEAREDMVRWAVERPSRGQAWAGYSRIMDEFGCTQYEAKQAAKEARARVQGTGCGGQGSGRVQSAGRGEQQQAAAPAEGSSYEESEDEARLVTVSREIATLEDALTYAKVDMETWEVARYLVNAWEMASKDADGKPQVTPLWQVKVWLKRRESTSLELALAALVERMPAAKPVRVKASRRRGKRKVEVALYDLHFGLLAWAPETGEDYDVTIARRITGDAVAQITVRTKDLGVEGFMLPIGNDLFHVNDPTGLTPMGRNRLDMDSRLPKIIEEAGLAMRDAVNALADIAPVSLVWVPGNHDPQTSYWMLRELAAFYDRDKRIHVDVSPRPRKVWRYGINLLWLLHGCDLARTNEKLLPGLFASEASDVWASGQYREIHRGHTHKKRELWFQTADTYGGVVVRTIPSLVATDAWHFEKGFVETSKTAQFFVWNRDYGLESVQDVHVDRGMYRHK